MPYDPDNPPSKIRKLSKKKQRQWVAVFNSALKRGASEESAHKQAWGAVKKEFDNCLDDLCGFISYVTLDKAVKWQHADGTWWTHDASGRVVPYSQQAHGERASASRHEVPAGQVDVRAETLRRLARSEAPTRVAPKPAEAQAKPATARAPGSKKIIDPEEGKRLLSELRSRLGEGAPSAPASAQPSSPATATQSSTSESKPAPDPKTVFNPRKVVRQVTRHGKVYDMDEHGNTRLSPEKKPSIAARTAAARAKSMEEDVALDYLEEFSAILSKQSDDSSTGETSDTDDSISAESSMSVEIMDPTSDAKVPIETPEGARAMALALSRLFGGWRGGCRMSPSANRVNAYHLTIFCQTPTELGQRILDLKQHLVQSGYKEVSEGVFREGGKNVYLGRAFTRKGQRPLAFMLTVEVMR